LQDSIAAMLPLPLVAMLQKSAAILPPQILDKELTHLEKAACHLDPVVQRAEAATVKLLASALLQVCGTTQLL
jgi:hypothetical protein